MTVARTKIFVGTAGWSIPKTSRGDFFAADVVKPDHLAAYAARFNGVEINSAFHRDHQPGTYAKWARSTPDDFRFSIKLAKRFTHEHKLKVDTADLRGVIEGITQLGEKLGVILVQIPPRLEFDEATVEEFFAPLRELYLGPVAFEARHPSWAQREATRSFEEYEVARVLADPDRIGPAPAIRRAPVTYVRLHGSPKVYYDAYDVAALERWAVTVRAASHETWCMFDNTARGAATVNAMQMQALL